MSNYPEEVLSQAERVFNTLPAGYRSWLEFYDDIPPWYRIADEIQVVKAVSKQEFFKAHGRESNVDSGLISYEMKRDFLLARCAEQMFASRLPWEEVLQKSAAYLAPLEGVENDLRPLFDAASAISYREKKRHSL